MFVIACEVWEYRVRETERMFVLACDVWEYRLRGWVCHGILLR